MPLIKCPMCEREISSNAVACPHCGEPINNIERLKIEYELVLVFLDNHDKYARNALMQLLNIDASDVKQMLNKVPIGIKRYSDYSEAMWVKNKLEEKHIVVKIEEVLNGIKSNKSTCIKCPNCNSISTCKISDSSKVGSTLLFGVFALGKLSKTWECKDCGYRW